ncbi:hypothetical protein ACDY96_25690 [Rhizobium mongolense]
MPRWRKGHAAGRCSRARQDRRCAGPTPVEIDTIIRHTGLSVPAVYLVSA